MKSYADDLPNVDNIVRAIREENDRVIDTLRKNITFSQNEISREYSEERSLREAGDLRIDALIQELKTLNEDNRKRRSETNWVLTFVVVLQLSTLGGLAYYIAGIL